MQLFDIFLRRNKKSFKTSRKSKKVNKFTEEELRRALEEYNDPSFDMFKSIFKYNEIKRELINKGSFSETELSESEVLSIINEVIKNTVETLPTGIIIPVKTSLKIDGVPQTLLIGKDLICMGKYSTGNEDKLKRGIKQQGEIAILVDTTKIESHDDFTKNIRLHMENDNDKIINLSSEGFLKDRWSTCRFSTVEINFTNWQDSNHHIVELIDSDIASQVFKLLPKIDEEMTCAINLFLERKAQYLSSTLKKENYTDKNDNITETTEA